MTNEVTSIGVGMDTDGVERGIKTLKVLAEQGPKVEKAMSGIEGAAKSTGRTLESLAKGAPDLKGVADGAQKAGSALGGMGQQAREAVTGTESLRRAMGQLSAEEQKYIKGLYDEARQLSMTRGEKAAYIAQSKGMSASAQEVARAIGNKVDALKQEQSALGMLRTGYGAAATAIQGFMALQVVSWSKQSASALYEASAAAERLKIGLDFASARGSAQEIAYLRSTTHSLGLAFQSTAQSYMQFQAAAKGTTLEGEKARAVFESVAKASAVMGLSAEQNSGVLLALQQMVSKGTVQAEELRGQLGERLPGAFQIAARAMGVTTAELGKMLEQGQVVSEDFLPKFAKELEASLGGAAEKAADRLDAAANRFDNAWERLKQNVGDSGVSRMMADSLGSAAGSLDAISLAMESARLKGDGFWGQMGAAIGVMDDLASGSDRLTVNMYDNAKATAEAQKELDRLQRLAATQGTSAWLLKEIANVQRYIGQLQQARREKEALLGGTIGASDPREKYSSPGADYANWLNQQEKARQGLLEISAKSNGVTKQFTGDLKAYEEALRTGVISTNDYVKAVTELNKKRYESTEAGKAEAKAAKDGAKGNKEGESAILSYIKSLEARTAAQRLEIAQGEKLTESQRARIQLEALLADSKNKASKSQIASAQASLAEFEANEAWLKNASDFEKALADMQKAREQSLRSVQESVKKLVEEAEATAYAEMHNISLAEAVERLALARAENAYQQAVERGESQQTLEALEKELQARKKIVELTAQKSVKEANDKAQEQLKRDWERTAQTIGDTLADYIMAGGKDAATYLKRLFATLVLQPVVQTVVGGVMGVGAAGASGVAAGGAGGIASLVQQAYSAFTSPMFTNFGMGLAGNIQQLGGTLFGKGFETLGTSVTNFGNTVAQFSGAINMAGNIFGYGSAIYSLSKGNYGSAIGTAAGTFLGGPIGAVLGSTLGGLLDGLFGGGRGANHSGGAYSTKEGNAAYQLGLGGDALRDFTSRGNASIANSVKGLVTTTVDAFDYLKKFNESYKGVDVAAGFAVNPRYGDEDAYGYFRVLDKVTGQLLSNYVRRDGGLGSDTTKAWSTYSADLIKAVYEQFKKSDITGWVQDELAVLDSAASLENLTAAVQAIAVIDAAFADFAKTVDGMQDLSGAVQTVLLRTSGGIEALSANVATYYQAFYSEQERAAKTAGQLAEVLKEYGVELPTTAEQYRDLVEQQLAAGESGAELAAVLLGMSGTFKEVSDVWQRELEGLSGSVTSFFGSLKDAIKSLIDDVSDDRKSILRGTGVMTAEELRAAIGAISVIGPSLGGVDAAEADIAAKEALRQSAKSASETAAQAAAAALARMEAYRDDPASAAAQAKALEAQREHALSEARKFEDGGMYRSYSYSTRVKWMNYWYPEAQRAQQQLNALQPALAAYNDQLAALQAEYDAAKLSAEQYAERLGDAESALRDAQQAEVQAKADYAAEMAKWIEEAGASVSKLSDLRGEVMSFYEAQAQAVQAMLASAGNIRAVVDAVRLNQLSAAQTAQELGARYAMDYSMALATTGTARAGYVDSMAGNLGALSEALRSESVTSTDWRVQTAKLLAQANKAADLLEGDAQGDNYQDVALGLLDDIDAKLEALSGVATAGENLIVQAIKEGTVNTLDGLRAVVAALKGDPVPAFAAGGLHAGGLRLVGERGPELEVTGPARYWSTSQTTAMLGGGNSSAASEAMVRELRELRQENRALQEAMVRQQADMTRLLMRWETQGMPEERVV